MRIQVDELFREGKSKYSIDFLAGNEGHKNGVYWVYLAEDISNMSFLKGGELIITTGIFTQSGISLYEFICSLIVANSAGLIINIGQYINTDDISEKIISLCNENNFPLFTMPWSVHLVDIMQDYCTRLLQNSQSLDKLDTAFQSAIYHSPASDGVLRTLENYGYPEIGGYSVIAIQNLKFNSRITQPLNGLGLTYHIIEIEHIKLFIYDTEKSDATQAEIFERLCYHGGIQLGISEAIHSLRDLGSAYKKARFALAVAVFRSAQVVRFAELGILQVLFSSMDTQMLINIRNKYLEKLDRYDDEHSSSLIQTLKFYLESDCNLITTAKKAFSHRNTIIYRINKIKEIAGFDFKNANEKFHIMLALYIDEYFSM